MDLNTLQSKPTDGPLEVYTLKTSLKGLIIFSLLVISALTIIYILTNDLFPLLVLIFLPFLILKSVRDSRKPQDIKVYKDLIQVRTPQKLVLLTKDEIAYFYQTELFFMKYVSLVSTKQAEISFSYYQLKNEYLHFIQFLEKNFSSHPTIDPIRPASLRYLHLLPFPIILMFAMGVLYEQGLSEKGLHSIVFFSLIACGTSLLSFASMKANDHQRINWKENLRPESKKRRKKFFIFFFLFMILTASLSVMSPLLSETAIRPSIGFILLCTFLTAVFFILLLSVFRFHKIFKRWEIVGLITYATIINSMPMTQGLGSLIHLYTKSDQDQLASSPLHLDPDYKSELCYRPKADLPKWVLLCKDKNKISTDTELAYRINKSSLGFKAFYSFHTKAK